MQKTKLLLNILAFFLCALPAIAVAQGGGNVTVRGIVTSADFVKLSVKLLELAAPQSAQK